MASLGKMTNAAVSLANENTFALVNINLDFSLFQLKPAEEFLPVGSALTVRRRQEAETGPTHRNPPNLFAGQVSFKHVSGPWSFSGRYSLWVSASKYAVCVQELDARLKAEFGQPQSLERGVDWLRTMVPPDKILKYLLALAKVK